MREHRLKRFLVLRISQFSRVVCLLYSFIMIQCFQTKLSAFLTQNELLYQYIAKYRLTFLAVSSWRPNPLSLVLVVPRSNAATNLLQEILKTFPVCYEPHLCGFCSIHGYYKTLRYGSQHAITVSKIAYTLFLANRDTIWLTAKPFCQKNRRTNSKM